MIEAWTQGVTAVAALAAAGISVWALVATKGVPERVQHLQGNQTREQFLRERKLETYSAFLNLMDEAERAIFDDEHPERFDDAQYHYTAEFIKNLNTLSLVASKDAIQAAREYALHFNNPREPFIGHLKLMNYSHRVRDIFTQDIQGDEATG